MKLRPITLTMKPGYGWFPSEPLADIEGDEASASTSSCMGGVPQLLLIVHYREKTTGERSSEESGRSLGASGALRSREGGV